MQCHIGLGGNVGDVGATMQAALSRIDAGDETRVTAVSRLYQTAPVGSRSGAPFHNAAAAVETALDPPALLGRLQQIEHQLGRVPGDRWTERPIDLDLLLCSAAVIDDVHLVVPHPHLWYRRFVLDPLTDVAAAVVHPVLGESIERLRNRLRSRPLTIAVGGGCDEDRLAVGALLRQSGVEVPATSRRDGPLRLAFVESDAPAETTQRVIELGTLPMSPIEAAQSVLTAALDEPQVHNRPLWRMP